MHPIYPITALLLTIPAAAPAQVFEYDVFKSVYYTQASADEQPSVPDLHQVFARMQFTSPGDVGDATVTFDGPASPWTLQNFGTVVYGFSPIYFDPIERDADYPAGTYTFTISGGTLDGDAGTLDLSEPLFCPEVPCFTGVTYTDLQTFETSSDFFGTVNTFTLVPGADFGRAFITIYDTSSVLVWSTDFEPDSGAFTIPAGTLLPSAEYRIYLYFSSRTFDPGAGDFTAAEAYTGFDLVTSMLIFTNSGGGGGCNPADITDIGDSGAGPDWQLTLDDILAFINDYNDGTGCPGTPPCNRADITDIGGSDAGPDGQLTLDDILAFIDAYNEGC